MSAFRKDIAALDRERDALWAIAASRGTTIGRIARPVPRDLSTWKLQEVATLRAKLADPQEVDNRSGVLYWRANGAVVPPHVYKDAELDCPAAQRTAYEKQERAFIAEYRRVQGKRKPSAEEMHEMRAAFGPGKTLVNVLTGRRTRT